MKQRTVFAAVAATAFTAVMCAGLAACGNKNADNESDKNLPQKVTAEGWTEAFSNTLNAANVTRTSSMQYTSDNGEEIATMNSVARLDSANNTVGFSLTLTGEENMETESIYVFANREKTVYSFNKYSLEWEAYSDEWDGDDSEAEEYCKWIYSRDDKYYDALETLKGKYTEAVFDEETVSYTYTCDQLINVDNKNNLDLNDCKFTFRFVNGKLAALYVTGEESRGKDVYHVTYQMEFSCFGTTNITIPSISIVED